MELKIEIRQLDELIAAFEKAPAEVKTQLLLALRVALRDVQERARSEHRFRTRSSKLELSVEKQIVSAWPPTGRVHLKSKVTMLTEGKWKGYSYGEFVHEGTRPHPIDPKNKKILRWPGANGFIWARHVDHPGTPPDQFLYKAAENERAGINATFDRYTEEAIRKAGLYG